MPVHELSDTTRLYYSPKGAILSVRYDRGVVLHVCKGANDSELASLVIGDGERSLREAGRGVFMVDGTDTTMMSTEFRTALTGWLKAQGDKVQTHLLIKSKLVEMSLTIANMVLGNSAKVYSNPRQFEAVGVRECPSFKRVPFSVPPELAGKLKYA